MDSPMSSVEDAKRAAGLLAVDRYVRDGTCIGLGTGSTAYWAVERVGERVAAGEHIRAIATSHATAEQCARLNIPVLEFGACEMDVAIAGTASGIFFNMGQCCTAGSRLFAHKSIYDKIVEGVAAEAGKLNVGHGLIEHRRHQLIHGVRVVALNEIGLPV